MTDKDFIYLGITIVVMTILVGIIIGVGLCLMKI